MSHEKHRIAIYPGTFDPMTKGHADLLVRSMNVANEIIIGISTSYSKTAIFTPQERVEIINHYLKAYNISDNVRIMNFEGLLVNFAASHGATIIIRGLRAVSDFEYEFQMACMNSRLDERIVTIFLPASEKNQFISSKLVKEIVSLGGDISAFVIPEIKDRLIKYYQNKS